MSNERSSRRRIIVRLTLKISFFKRHRWSFKGSALSSFNPSRKSPYPKVASSSPLQRNNPNKEFRVGRLGPALETELQSQKDQQGQGPSRRPLIEDLQLLSPLERWLSSRMTWVDEGTTVTSSSSGSTLVVEAFSSGTSIFLSPARKAFLYPPREPQRPRRPPELQSQ